MMRGTQLFALFLVALLVVPSPAVGLVRGSPELDVTVADDTVVPGEVTTLQVTVANNGNLDAGSATNPKLNDKVTTARGVDVTLESNGAPVSVETGTNTVGGLAQGKSVQLPFVIAVEDGADPGTYDLEADVEYTYTSVLAEQTGVVNLQTETRTYDVTIEVDDRARFEVVETTTDLRVGSSGSVAVTMENVGTEAAADTTVSLESQNSDLTFGTSKAGSRFVGDWGPGETKTIEYQVTASAGANTQRYAFTATASFEDGDGMGRTATPRSLAVTPLPEQRFSVVATEHTVAVGDSGTLTATLRNDGEIPVNDATVTVQSKSQDLLVGNSASASRYVGDWQPGENVTVAFDLTATGDADTRSYALSSTVAYDDPDDNPATATPVSLGVTPQPGVEFSLADVTADLQVGEERTLEGTITNEGETVATDVVLRYTSDSQNIHPLEREYAVGTLQPGESATVEYSLDISDAAESGPRQFGFVATYHDGADNPHKSDELRTRQHVAADVDTFDVAVRDGTLTNGNTTALSVEVTNTANETLTDVSAKLFADDPITATDDEAYVDELEPGESTTLTFSVSASGAIPKEYPLSLDFEYDDTDGDTHLSRTYKVPVTVESSAGGGISPMVVLPALAGIGGLWWKRESITSLAP